MTTASPPPAAASASATATPIHTYHCICTQLLLATTTPLPSLPRRGTGTPDAALLDRAHVLPLPTRPPTGDADNDGEHYALTLNTQGDRKPRIVRREDGLEKRWVQRCARCRCAVGYQLDWAHFAGGAEGEGGEGRSGGRRDVVYLLPGALLGTEEMARGEGREKVGGGKG